MNIDQFQELRQKLTSEPDLSNIWLFYMDHFADHAEFTDLGEPAYNEYMETNRLLSAITTTIFCFSPREGIWSMETARC